jgi:crotonobetainyl-CoA:carnitine CoA-transferase CaiB-like acyl-CoA transferase
MSTANGTSQALYEEIRAGLGDLPNWPAPAVEWWGTGTLPSVFATSDLAAASIGAAGAEVASLLALAGHGLPAVRVDRRLASLWFQWSTQPIGWKPAPPWDPIAGDYRAADGFIRLHTNAPHHRAAALRVLQVPAEKGEVAAAVETCRAEDLEAAVVRAGGCAAAMRSLVEWEQHPQGLAVRSEPLIAWHASADRRPEGWRPEAKQPLKGIRVLDLTRVLAGPVATRFLAGFGAEVLRIDPPDWDEPGVIPEVTLGKRCARLDLKSTEGVTQLKQLLESADVLVHGYRADALERLGLGADVRRAIRPGLIDVALNAYGWTGPWRSRRGFDSLVQMSAGIAEAGMQAAGGPVPKPLPVQALDHATGYLMAAAAIRGLSHRLSHGGGATARVSLARTASLLSQFRKDSLGEAFPPATDAEWATEVEASEFGPMRRLRPPISLGSTSMGWALPACRPGSSPPRWVDADRTAT